MMKATFLLVLVSGCAHLELPAPTRPHGRQVMATMLDSSRHSGELIGTTEELIVLGDLVSAVHFSCLRRVEVGNLVAIDQRRGLYFAYPFLGLAALGAPHTAIALTPMPVPQPEGGVVVTDRAGAAEFARYAEGVPDQILARCSR